MRARLLRLSNDLRESYWFVPTVMALAALLLALGMVYVDSHFGSTWMDGLPWLYAARPDGARSLLSSIGGSMIGVAGTTFSVTIAAVVYASGQYGPRLLSNFMSDRGNQVTLGTFIATFVYSLVVLRTIRSAGESGMGAPAFVPQLALLVALILVLCSIVVLIFFIHHVPMRIHINNVIERIGERLIEEIDERFPVFVGKPLAESADDPRIPFAFCEGAGPADYERRAPVRSKHTGYIQLIDESTMLNAARDHDLIVRLQYQSGDHAVKDCRLACLSAHRSSPWREPLGPALHHSDVGQYHGTETTMSGMTISMLARAGNVGVETVRFYQRRRLLDQPDRPAGAGSSGGIRRYGKEDAERLRFIRAAQKAGFSLEEIRGLLKLDRDADRTQIRMLAQQRLHDLDHQIEELAKARAWLAELEERCGRDNLGPCPIIEAIANAASG